MKKYSQRELLSEGIWSGIKALGRGADYVLSKAAPEVRALYRDPYYAVKGLTAAMRGKPQYKSSQSGTKGSETVISSDVLMSIKNGLQRRNITVSNQKPIRFVAKDPQSGNAVYAVTIVDTTSSSNPPRVIYVDKNGFEITN
jgi:hypothetical protein